MKTWLAVGVVCLVAVVITASAQEEADVPTVKKEARFLAEVLQAGQTVYLKYPSPDDARTVITIPKVGGGGLGAGATVVRSGQDYVLLKLLKGGDHVYVNSAAIHEIRDRSKGG